MSIVDGHYRHGLRRMVGRSVEQPGRAATPLELLYDLTFVAAFGVAGSELAHGIAAGHAGEATLAFIVTMGAIVWAWINFTWFASAFDTDDWLFRLLTMVQMAGVIVLAIGIPPIFASIEEGIAHNGGVLDNRVLVAGYVVIRVAIILQWVRAGRADPTYRRVALAYATFGGVAQVGWVAVALLELPVIPGLVTTTLLFALEAMAPIRAEAIGKRTGSLTPWHPRHIAERHSLLAIIAIGETVIGTLASANAISASEGWTVDAVVVIAAGVALSFALWWVYFLLPSEPILEVRRDRAFPWTYGHVVIFAAIAATGAGIHVVGYAFDPHYEVDTPTVVLASAIPVLVFMVALSLVHAWLLRAVPAGMPIRVVALVLPAVAVILALVGCPLWVCLLVVLASPTAVAVAHEVGGWRALDAQLTRVVASVRD